MTADCCALTNAALYSCAKSSTCVTQDTSVSVSYITGSWTGALVQDTFSGAGIGAAVPSVPVVAIQTESSFVQTGYDGIVGLSYAAVGSPVGKAPTPYFDKMQSAKSLANVFSMLMCGSLQMLPQSNVSLASLANDSSQMYAGELVLGGADGVNGERYYQGELAYTPLVQRKWYNVVLTDVRVSGASLGLSCKALNTPRSIVDSGTSNIAFPSAVFAAVVAQLKTDVRKVLPTAPDSFFSDDVPCCSALCDPTDAGSKIYKLPPLALAFAVSGSDQQITISIPPEYIWRPILVTTTTGSVRACRVFGISEGDITLLGDVFMDGLFTVHDREHDRLGFGVAKTCPNGVTSAKNVTVEALSGSLCDCVSDADRKSSLLSSYFPIGSSKPCFFWQWWMYVVVVSVVVIIVAAAVVAYLSWRRRKLLKQLQDVRAARQQRPQRQLSDGLDRNLLTPSARGESSDALDSADAIPITIHSSKVTDETISRTSLHGGYRPPSTSSTASVHSTRASPAAPTPLQRHETGESAV